MKKTGFCLVLMLGLVLSATSRADLYIDKAKQDPFYAEIVKTAETSKGIDVVQFISAKLREDMGRIHASSVWLRENSVAQADPAKINSLYFLIYSDLIFLMANELKTVGGAEEHKKLVQMAMQVLYAYEIMAMADAGRCEDKSVPDALGMNTLWDRYQSQEVQAAYKILARADFENIERVALLMEEQAVARPPNKDICSMGAASVEYLLRQPGVQTKEIDDASFAGGKRTEIIAPPGYAYDPKIVTDEQWHKNRADFRDKYARIWTGRYTKNTTPAPPSPQEAK